MMFQYIVRRFFTAIPVLFGILLVTFALARLIPGKGKTEGRVLQICHLVSVIVPVRILEHGGQTAQRVDDALQSSGFYILAREGNQIG